MQCHVFGASGFTGLELLSLLELPIAGCASETYAGTSPSALKPGLRAPLFERNDVVMARVQADDVVFLATPAEASVTLAQQALAKGARVIDLSGAHRLHDSASHERAYGFAQPKAKAAYGLPELGQNMKGVRLVANPGCYATAATLALLPLVEGNLVGRDLLVDAASGTSGAGRQTSEAFSHAEVANDHRAYRVLRHQHTPEIRQALGGKHLLTLTTKLLPIERGILATAYARLLAPMSSADLTALYRKRYAAYPLVEVLAGPDDVRIKNVAGRNVCQLAVAAQSDDSDPGRVVVCAAIDNLRKGAASQALENLQRLLKENE